MLARLALSWVLNIVVLAIVAYLLNGVTFNGSFGSLVIAAAVFGVLNTLLKPILKLLTFPFAILTLGLAWFGVAMFMLWLTDVIVSDFDINGFWTLVWATIIVWVANVVLDLILDRSDRGRDRGKSAPAR